MAFIFRKAKKVRPKNNHLRDFISDHNKELLLLLGVLWEEQSKSLTYKQIKQIISTKDVQQDIINGWQESYTKYVEESLQPVWEKAFKFGVDNNNIMPTAIRRGFTFNSNNEYIRQWIRSRSAELVTNITDTQRSVIRMLLEENVKGRLSQNEVMKLLRSTIGLTDKQLTANLNYYNSVKRILREQFPKMSAANLQQKARERSFKYAKQQLRYRAEMIVNTELANAANFAAHECVVQAVREGYLGHIVKEWSSARNERVCPVCEKLNGQRKELHEEFDFGKLNPYVMDKTRPPAHPFCACVVKYVEITPP